MKKMAVLGFLIFQSIALSGFAASPYNTKAESSASETSGNDGVVQTVANTTFAFTNLYNPQKQNFTDILISQKIENTVAVGKDATSKLETNAWVSGKSRYDTKMWTINDCADAGWRSGDFYWTSKYGVNGAENLQRAYNFKTGKYAFSFTTAPAIVDIYIPKDIVKRHIAYVSRKGTDSECRKNDIPKSAIGVLTLSDGEGQMDRVLLEAEDEDLARSPSILLVTDKETKGSANLSVWGPAEFAHKSDVVKGFSVKVLFRDGIEAVIPVANDKFDVQKAVLPKSIKARRIDVEKTAEKAEANKS